MTRSHEPLPSAAAARTALLLAVVWRTAGALFKLLAGSPNNLPESIREFPLLKPDWTFRLAIGTELAISALVLVRPRTGWPVLVLLFVLFDLLLYKMLEAGETKCGCFGGNTPDWLTPFVMMIVDSVLALGVLVTRPWRSFGPGRPSLLPGPLLITMLLGCLVALPWHSGFFEVARPPAPSLPPTGEDAITGDDGQVQGTQSAEATGDWRGFTPSDWEGQMIGDAEFAEWIEGGPDMAWNIPAPAHVVFYRVDCEHCRAHFIKLQENPPPFPVALIRIPDLQPGDDVVSDVKPVDAAVDLSLFELPKGYGITTPVHFNVDEAFMIKKVQVKEQDQ